jgi:hypothetical protein
MGGAASSSQTAGIMLAIIAIATIVLTVLFGLLYAFETETARVGILNTYQAWVFGVLFCSIPYGCTLLFAKLLKGRLWEIKFTFVCLVAYYILFIAYYFIYPNIPIAYLIYLCAFFLFVTTGGAIVLLLKERFLVNYGSKKSIIINPYCMRKLREFFKIQQRVYWSIPLGFFIGVIAGFFAHLNAFETFFLSIKITLILATILLSLVQVMAFEVTSHPFIKKSTLTDDAYIPFIFTTEKAKETHGKIELYSEFHFNLKTLDENRILNLSIALADIRKIYFYYNILNGLILSSLIHMALTVFNVQLSQTFIVILFAAVTFLSSQLPYAFGQSNMRTILLEFKEGIEKEDLKEKLEKYTPLLPKFGFLISMTSGFAGGVLFEFVSNILKEAIK